MGIFGGIEAGGTKFLCGIGTCPEDLRVVSFPTQSPDVTVDNAAQFFREQAGTKLSAIGIASFGPIDLDPASETYGYVTSTP
jgi:fructokinase